MLGLAAPLGLCAEPDLAATVQADWSRQETRLGRAPEDLQAIHAAAQRAEALLRDRSAAARPGAFDREWRTLGELQERSAQASAWDVPARREFYFQLRSFTRELALANPLLASREIAFLKRRRFICQMLHEYLGYFYDYGDVAGGGVFVLTDPGHSFATRDLIANRLPRGNYTTLVPAWNARTLYFAFAERAGSKPAYHSPERKAFHLFALDLASGSLRQLTTGPDDDFDPCPLPNGQVIFMSSRRGGWGRCHNPWEPLPTYTLHRMNADGSEIETLSFHETNEWHPAALPDGRIIYTRWDYVDRSAANFHGLWTSNPDGSNPLSVFGNYTTRINACYQPKPVPGSSKIAFIAGAHHADVGGSLVLLDPHRARLEPRSGEDSFAGVEVLTPEVCFPEAPGWPGSYFHSAWPLAENYYLTAFSFDPLPGMGPNVNRDTRTGLYYFDRFGNLELLFQDAEASCMYPILLTRRKPPVEMATVRDPALADEAELLVSDVHQSLMPLPAERPIRALRVFQILPKIGSHVANQPRLGYANAESARMFLGTVPVEPDGSAYFRVPARKPLYFQAVDEKGRAVQSMRSITYLQPGERRGCVGCHEPTGRAPSSHRALAFARPPSQLEPGPEGSLPLSFPRLMQPVLDAHCVRCHNGEEGPGHSSLVLLGEPKKNFSLAYLNLKPFVRWHEWGDASISQIATRPGKIGADASPLSAILSDSTHAPIGLPEAARRRIYLWLDANAPFYGSYLPADQLAQSRGELIAPPPLQ